MCKQIPIFGLFFCAGCLVSRTTETLRVVDVETFKPIGGATVWKQAWAPIHPFWPLGDWGVTDDSGEVRLSRPTGFWFYFEGVCATGYSQVRNTGSLPRTRPTGGWANFYMRRTPASFDK
jgi:hypothetical protein